MQKIKTISLLLSLALLIFSCSDQVPVNSPTQPVYPLSMDDPNAYVNIDESMYLPLEAPGKYRSGCIDGTSCDRCTENNCLRFRNKNHCCFRSAFKQKHRNQFKHCRLYTGQPARQQQKNIRNRQSVVGQEQHELSLFDFLQIVSDIL